MLIKWWKKVQTNHSLSYIYYIHITFMLSLCKVYKKLDKMRLDSLKSLLHILLYNWLYEYQKSLLLSFSTWHAYTCPKLVTIKLVAVG